MPRVEMHQDTTGYAALILWIGDKEKLDYQHCKEINNEDARDVLHIWFCVVHVDDTKAVGRPKPVTTRENGRGERLRTSGPCRVKAVLSTRANIKSITYAHRSRAYVTDCDWNGLESTHFGHIMVTVN